MISQFFFSLTAFSLGVSGLLFADAAPSTEKTPPTKKQKAHFAGARQNQPKQKTEKKKSSRVKNEWVKSKTHPKPAKAEVADNEEEIELISDHPYYLRSEPSPLFGDQSLSTPTPSSGSTQATSVVEEEGHEYPRGGFQAPRGHVYVTGEWLFWRTREEGIEFAPTKTIHFDYESGFRVGLGVHLPYDKWDIYVNYTNFNPAHSGNAEGFFYPLWLFEAAAVTHAQAHWKISFQTVDVEIGRAYYIARTLVFRPFFGLKGAWIDQHGHAHYQGGFIPVGATFETKLTNDFKGAGPLIGIESNWGLGYGFSLFGDAATALVIGQFENKQEQKQLDGFEPIDLHTHLHLVSPMVQLVTGVAWDLNFHKRMCHVGLSAGFEAQYWWSQNQTELFTSTIQPIYVREKGNLSFYGLTLRGRFDF